MLPKQIKEKKNYEECYNVTNLYFPQYIHELKGIAEGADVSFEKLFLIHMDEIIMINNAEKESYNENDARHFESSTVLGISNDTKILGYNVDVLKETTKYYYIVNAHIVPDEKERGGYFEAREEIWTSLTYAGMLSGYMGGFNYHGLAYTVNTVYSDTFKQTKIKIPRVFLTRALLASKDDIDEIEDILKNFDVGTADAFIVLFGFINENNTLYSIEVTPNDNDKSTTLRMSYKENYFYANRLMNTLNFEELKNLLKTSNERNTKYTKFFQDNSVISFENVKRMLGIADFHKCQIYRDYENDPMNTMITVIFDFNEKTWTIWTKNPALMPSILKLSLEIHKIY